ncbi:MAG: hypothetical protein KKA90_04200 [Nanoarchaeota archaeon]|nr:hypothetical protein [Nanoarchaeota archaeon]
MKYSVGVQYALLIIAATLIVFNQVSLATLHPGQMVTAAPATDKTSFAYAASGDPVQDAIDAVLFTGSPAWSDGSISYDDIEGSLEILGNLDRTIPLESLPADLKERYIAIGSKISCEYCCTAPSVIFPDGNPACGCSHSFALRGIAKYLLTQYGDSYTDEEVLFEMTVWKNLFFPKNTVEKAAALIANRMDITPDALNDHTLLEKIQAGDLGSIGAPGMVGGC